MSLIIKRAVGSQPIQHGRMFSSNPGQPAGSGISRNLSNYQQDTSGSGIITTAFEQAGRNRFYYTTGEADPADPS